MSFGWRFSSDDADEIHAVEGDCDRQLFEGASILTSFATDDGHVPLTLTHSYRTRRRGMLWTRDGFHGSKQCIKSVIGDERNFHLLYTRMDECVICGFPGLHWATKSPSHIDGNKVQAVVPMNLEQRPWGAALWTAGEIQHSSQTTLPSSGRRPRTIVLSCRH